MKNNVFKIVLTIIMVVSTVSAQDTLRITSFRVIDVCSSEKSWLISLSLGRINFSDSLESFDIAIGFDRNVLRPGSVLKEGTLSAQVSNGPVMNLIVPNEMRIYGFNIARAVAGDLPLFAVTGEFIGTCDSVGRFYVPAPPDFNAEFKRRFTVTSFDSVLSVSKVKIDKEFGCDYSVKSATIGEDSLGTEVNLELRAMTRVEGKEYKVVMELANQSDTGLIKFTDVRCNTCLIDSVVRYATKFSAHISGSVNDSTIVTASLKRVDTQSGGDVSLRARLENIDACECRAPGLTDTMTVTLKKPTVNVQTSDHDGTCTIAFTGGIIVGMCHHGQMKTLSLLDLRGNVIQRVEGVNEKLDLSTSDVTNGMYFVTLSCDTVQTRKLILK